MREIGSEFWDVPLQGTDNGIFPDNTQWFLSGRVALRAVIHNIKNKVKTAGLPSWCCDSMIVPFEENGIQVAFYSVRLEDEFIQDVSTRFDCDVLLVMDYFGYSNVPDIGDYKGIVIYDLTHSIFQQHAIRADYYFGSLRKWCGVWTGGFAYRGDAETIMAHTESEDNGYTVLRKKAMKDKREFMKGKKNKRDYLAVFNEAEILLERIDRVINADQRDVNIARRLDADFIRSQRQENARVLLSLLDGDFRPIFSAVNETDCPMFVPILTKNRDRLRRMLIENNIFCPIHWPFSKYHKDRELEKNIYSCELSLVCDQRYTPEDMESICSIIKAGMRS